MNRAVIKWRTSSLQKHISFNMDKFIDDVEQKRKTRQEKNVLILIQRKESERKAIPSFLSYTFSCYHFSPHSALHCPQPSTTTTQQKKRRKNTPIVVFDLFLD